ncbi:MAG TPA: GNAT family N-acetyltransferase [Pirellulales bacterium]
MHGHSAEISNSPSRVTVLYNALALPEGHRDFASEVGVLESVAAVCESLATLGHEMTKLAAGSSIAALVGRLEASQPDVVTNLCESFAGRADREPHVASLLELLNIPFTGSPPECLRLTHDKPLTKRLLTAANVPTAEFVEVCNGQPLPGEPLQAWLQQSPLFVKPAREDASLGIESASVCTNWESLVRQVAAIQQRFGDVLVERYIAGREFNVGIIELPDLQMLAISEVEFQTGDELPWPILTYAGKWSPESKECRSTPIRCPAAIERDLAGQLEKLAITAYIATQCRDYARVDFRVDEQGRIFVLEVNANPDIGPTAGFARMLAPAGISYQDFVRRLVAAAACRDNRFRGIQTDANERCSVGHRNTTKSDETNNPSQSRRRLDSITIRNGTAADHAELLKITRACGVFRPDEIEIADEVLRDGLTDPPVNGYCVLVAEHGDRAIGWSCHGRVPLTDATYDLYWIAIAPEQQGLGAGKQLLNEVERRVAGGEGRWLLAETSSLTAYDATREFYRRCGYSVVSEIPDFYRPEDGKITFGKRFN